MAAEGNGRGVRVRLGLETVHATAVHRGWVTAAFFDERVVIRPETNPETGTVLRAGLTRSHLAILD